MLLAKLCHQIVPKSRELCTEYIILSFCFYPVVLFYVSIIFGSEVIENRVYIHPAWTCSISTMKTPVLYVNMNARPVESWQ